MGAMHDFQQTSAEGPPRHRGRIAIWHPGPFRRSAFQAVAVCVASAAAIAQADVAVLCNRTSQDVACQVAGATRPLLLAVGEVVPIHCRGRALPVVRLGLGAADVRIASRRHVLLGRRRQRGIDLRRIGLTGDTATDRRLVPFDASAADTAHPPVGNTDHALSADGAGVPLLIVPVKLLVDEDEPAAREVWEKRLRRDSKPRRTFLSVIAWCGSR